MDIVFPSLCGVILGVFLGYLLGKSEWLDTDNPRGSSWVEGWNAATNQATDIAWKMQRESFGGGNAIGNEIKVKGKL